MPVPTLTIGPDGNPVLAALPGVIIQTPESLIPQRRFPITTITTLTITRDMHHIAHPTSVTVCEASGEVIWVDMVIDPLNGNITIHAEHPVTGYVLIR